MEAVGLGSCEQGGPRSWLSLGLRWAASLALVGLANPVLELWAPSVKVVLSHLY